MGNKLHAIAGRGVGRAAGENCEVKMIRRAICWGLTALLALYLFGCGNAHPASSPLASPVTGTAFPTCNATEKPGCHIRLLVFSKTAAFRHASIPDAIAALRRLAQSQGITIDFTEDSTVFTDANLARYNAVVFLLTTGHILDADQQAAFERNIEHGGGYAGVHSASDTEYNWPWYGQLVGAYFDRVHGHSQVVPATVYVVDHNHPSTGMLPAIWIRTDEWYNFATNPSNTVHVLLTVDERTYQGGVMGANHPIAWYHAFDGGRSWYTAMGHTSESYAEPLFLSHLWGGILYAAGDTSYLT